MLLNQVAPVAWKRQIIDELHVCENQVENFNWEDRHADIFAVAGEVYFVCFVDCEIYYSLLGADVLVVRRLFREPDIMVRLPFRAVTIVVVSIWKFFEY